MPEKAWRVLIAGGGTGGHLYPGLAVARELLRRHRDARVTFVGTGRGIESKVVPREGFALDTIRSTGLAGKSLLARVRGLVVMPQSFIDAWRVLSRRTPDLVIGVGGYSSGAVVLLAAGRGIPTMLLEQNAIPGLTNRLLARVVRAAAVTYEESLSYFGGKGFVSGNPVRQGFFDAPPTRDESAAGPRRVLVAGGSQGAHPINVAMMAAAPDLARSTRPLFVVHQTGERDVEAVRGAYRDAALAARVEPFLEAMDREMHEADIVVCRAGATTLAELAAAGRPAILVPFPQATHDHQRRNAAVLARAGAADVVEQGALSGPDLARRLVDLMADEARRRRMAAAMHGFARPDAVQRIVDRAEQIGGRRRRTA